jgi:hypothetical protein
MWLPYEHWSVAKPTRASRQTFRVACFFPLWRLYRPSQDGERTVPLANMLFGAKNANIAQLMRRLDCRVHEETPRPLKLTHEFHTRNRLNFLVIQPNICNRIRYIDLNDKTSL